MELTKNYVYVRNFRNFGLLTIASSKQHLSTPHTEWDRYNSVKDGEARLEEWGFVETTASQMGIGKKYFPEGEYNR